MAINLELPRKLNAVIEMAHQGATEMLRPISRKWDLREHEYPVELDALATLFEGISQASFVEFAATWFGNGFAAIVCGWLAGELDYSEETLVDHAVALAEHLDATVARFPSFRVASSM